MIQVSLIWKSPSALYYRTMYMKKGSEFTPFIKYEAKKLNEIGIMNVLSKRHITPEPNCKPFQSRGRTIGMEKFASVFSLYSIGIVISLIILVIETIFKASRPISQSAQKEKDILSLETFEIELQILVASKGLKISGDIQSGWIIVK